MALVTSLLIAASLAAVNAETFSGDGTAYTLGAPMDGNCNMMYAPKAASANYAALNNEQWDDMANCGRCAKVWSPDTPDNSALVYILDRCPECAHGDLDLSPTVFKKITGSGPSRLPIQWEFADCPVESNIQLCLKSGSNPYYMAVQPTNVAVGVKDMAINDIPCSSMVDSAYYFLAESQGDLNSVKVQLTSVNGDSVEDTVSMQAGNCVEMNGQFGTASGGGDGGYDNTTSGSSTSSAGDDTTPTPPDAPIETPTEAPTEAPTTAPSDTPATVGPRTDVPDTASQSTDASIADEFTTTPTDTPPTDAPAPDAPAMETPTTNTPTDSPATDSSDTDAPVTEYPDTDVPATEIPVTNAPACRKIKKHMRRHL